MPTHLTPKQIDAYLIGERTPEVEQHLLVCAQCRSEVRKIAQTLDSFKQHFTERSDREEKRTRVTKRRFRPPKP
jgi:anti-sigma factor RsiW